MDDRGWKRIKWFWDKDKFYIIIAVISILATLLSVFVNFRPASLAVKALILNLSDSRSTFNIIGNAYASGFFAEGNWETVNWKLLISLMFTFGVFVAFFWSFAMSMHSQDPTKVQTAKEHAKLFGGILIGSAQAVIGA